MTEKLILGTVQLGLAYGINNRSGKPNTAGAAEILTLAKNSGITLLDTANAYGDATDVIGNFHRVSDFTFKVISKFHGSDKRLLSDLEKELSLLGISNFEAYMFHSYTDFENATPELVEELKQCKRNGLVKKIGVSVYGNAEFEKASASDWIDLIQFPYNLLDNQFQRGNMMALAKERGKELHVRSVFLQGLFFMDPALLPEKLIPLQPYLQQIQKLAGTSNVKIEELALIYALQNKLIDKVLIGVDSVQQLKTNIDVAGSALNFNKELLNKIDTIQVKEINLLSPVNWN